jgi:uncharacterized protein (TIGR03435 family)
MCRASSIAMCLLAASLYAQLQPEATSTILEVASVRQHTGAREFSDLSTSGTKVTVSALTLGEVIANAYHLRDDQIVGGPRWLATDLYDITAKAEGTSSLTAEQSRQLLQAVLADRFGLQCHRETRETPVYALLVGKDGSKLQDADISGNNPGMRMTTSSTGKHIVSRHSTMQQLALMLSGTAGRPVVDKTGLPEKYAFHLDWNPANAPDSDTPSIFTAVQQQLGLRLEPQKAPFEILVIDSADRPSAN